MSLKKLGRVTIKANGQVFGTYPGATLDPGGTTRNAKVGHEVYGFSETARQGSLEIEIDYDDQTSLQALQALDDATVLWEPDVGKSMVGNHWWCTGEVTVTDGSDSKVSLKFEGPAMEEM